MRRPSQGQSNGQSGLVEEVRSSFNLAMNLAQAVGTTVLPLLRVPGTQGELAYGRHAALGFIFLMPLYSVFWQGQDGLNWLIGFWFLALVALAYQQSEGRRKRRSGYVVHSQYEGTPLLPGGSSHEVRSALEPLAVMASGFFALSVSPPLGCWLLAAGLARGVDVHYQEQALQARLRQMKDAQLESEYLLSRFQEKEG